MRVREVVVENDVLWLAEERKDNLLARYGGVVKVGSNSALERRVGDNVVAAYCRTNNCDLLTGDTTVYDEFFDIGVKTLQIERFDWVKGRVDKKIYLIRIVD